MRRVQACRIGLNPMFSTTWIGDCSAWECDELGHLNMSFYFDKFEQARMGLFIRLGLTDAFGRDAQSTVRNRDAHIKYLAEARPGSPLRVESALIRLGESDAQACHIMYHIDGRIAATFVETVEHIYNRTQAAFPWPSRLRDIAEHFTDQMPEPARARNLSLDWDIPAHSADALDGLGVASIGGGVFRPDDIMPAGHVPLSKIFRRITTSLGWFSQGWPEFADPAYMRDGGSAVVLEIRVHAHHYISIGTAYDLRPAVAGAEGYIRNIMHNVLDVETGQSILSGYAAGGLFNLNTRKLTPMTDAQKTVLIGHSVEALAPPRP